MDQYKNDIAEGRYYVHRDHRKEVSAANYPYEAPQKRKKFKKLKTVSGDELMKKTVKPVRFVVKDLLPRGLSILSVISALNTQKIVIKHSGCSP